MNIYEYVKFEVLTELLMKVQVFWVVLFGVTYSYWLFEGRQFIKKKVK
jgi:hypothetical protein